LNDYHNLVNTNASGKIIAIVIMKN
jgi:hypothetical protein